MTTVQPHATTAATTQHSAATHVQNKTEVSCTLRASQKNSIGFTLCVVLFTLLIWASMLLDPAQLGSGKGGWTGLFQADSEALVLGGVAADVQNGFPLGHALCQPQGWSKDTARTHQNTFLQAPCDWIYTGNMGIQRLVWVPVAGITEKAGFSDTDSVFVLKTVATLFTSMAMGFIVYGVAAQWGRVAGGSTAILFLTANQWVLVGPNLYWMGAFWLLPIAWLLFSKTRHWPNPGYGIWVGLGGALILKLLSGLEGAPAILAMACVVAAALWGWKAGITAAFTGGVALSIAVGLHLTWASYMLGNWNTAWADFIGRVMKRTIGNPDVIDPTIQASLQSTAWIETIKHLFLYPGHAHFAPGVVALPALVTLALCHRTDKWSSTMGCVLAAWLAALAWPIVAPPHTFIHGSLMSFLTIYGTIATYIAAAHVLQQRGQTKNSRATAG